MRQAKTQSPTRTRPRRNERAFEPERKTRPKGEGPLRQCILTRESYPKEVMIRFVVAPDGTLAPDLQAKLPGRGAWVIADKAALETAAKKHIFSRALEKEVAVPSDLSERVEALLVRRLLALLGQAQSAGQLILGAGAVHAAARRGEVAAAIEAMDGAEDGRRKTLAALKAGGLLGRDLGRSKVMVVGCFTSTELSLALGRENVIHAALPEGGLAGRFVAEARRLAGFRPLIPKVWAELQGQAWPGAVCDS